MPSGQLTARDLDRFICWQSVARPADPAACSFDLQMPLQVSCSRLHYVPDGYIEVHNA